MGEADGTGALGTEPIGNAGATTGATAGVVGATTVEVDCGPGTVVDAAGSPPIFLPGLLTVCASVLADSAVRMQHSPTNRQQQTCGSLNFTAPCFRPNQPTTL